MALVNKKLNDVLVYKSESVTTIQCQLQTFKEGYHTRNQSDFVSSLTLYGISLNRGLHLLRDHMKYLNSMTGVGVEA